MMRKQYIFMSAPESQARYKKTREVCLLLRNNSSTIACFVKSSEKTGAYNWFWRKVMTQGQESSSRFHGWPGKRKKHFFLNPYAFYAMLSLPIWLKGPPDIMGKWRNLLWFNSVIIYCTSLCGPALQGGTAWNQTAASLHHWGYALLGNIVKLPNRFLPCCQYSGPQTQDDSLFFVSMMIG